VTSYVPVVRPVALPQLRRRYSFPDNADVLILSLLDVAASMIAILPVIAIFVLFQRQFVSGIASGALKA